MIETAYIDRILKETEQKLKKIISNKKYEDALAVISAIASILNSVNCYYTSPILEENLEIVSKQLQLNTFTSKDDYQRDDNVLLFYDGFGLNSRGLIQIYLKALCKVKKIVYVTYADCQNRIPDVLEILHNSGSEICYLERRNKLFTDRVNQLNGIVRQFRPGHVFFYSVPDDVVATPILYAYKGYFIRYQINLTDHAFWLGSCCLDKCIEFRDYGAKISKEYRNIDEDKIVIVPFYPMIHVDREFQGYPFKVEEGQKVVFSGGSLYKTLGGDNKYYEIVNHILENHPDTLFWYAGSGDDREMRKVIDKYPDRAFLTNERSDLFQVLEHSRMYLSTYPMCGGLMFQYAAMAGCVPITLKSGNISDGFLINQDTINIEFNDIESLYLEVDKLLSDDNYRNQRSSLMRDSVISPNVFDEEIQKLVEGIRSEAYVTKYEHIDTSDFRKWYLEEKTKKDLYMRFAQKKSFVAMLKYYPFKSVAGGLLLFSKKIKSKMQK